MFWYAVGMMLVTLGVAIQFGIRKWTSIIDDCGKKMLDVIVKNANKKGEFYEEYHGHRLNDLDTLLKFINQETPTKHVIYLLGDSSMDNKHWVSPMIGGKSTINCFTGYQKMDNIKNVFPDLCWHVNDILHIMNQSYVAVNCAIEESTVYQRREKLLPHDDFVRHHLTENDILIVSIGGNDIALYPTFGTVLNILLLRYFNSLDTIKHGNPVGLAHFVDLLKDQIESYLNRLVENKKPKMIIINMIYFPSEHLSGSWADATLKHLGYDSNPKRLQEIITRMFQSATSQIKIKGTTVVPFAMYSVLDGKIAKDYSARVEPSDVGGRKLAAAFVNLIEKHK